MGKVKVYYREQQQYQAKEYANYYGKILMILKKCNLSDLRTIYETLFENGFRSEE